MAVRKSNAAGSTNTARADVLRVLGVLKVATTDQIQRIAMPHLNHRHTEKPTAAKRKAARTATRTPPPWPTCAPTASSRPAARRARARFCVT